MFPALKNNAAAGFQGPVKIELLKGGGLLIQWPLHAVSQTDLTPPPRPPHFPV